MKKSTIFKTEIIITVVVVIAVSFMASILYQAYTQPAPEPGVEPRLPVSPVPTTTPAPQPTTQVEDTVPGFTVGVLQNPCENCHLTGKPGVPQAVRVHKEMARYCLLCHSINHKTHPMSDAGVECSDCHGKSAAVPTPEEGAVRCGKCHNYPDPLTPSNGNLIIVHRPRGVGCPTCHGGNVMDIHLSGKNVKIEDMLQRLGRT